MRKTMAMAAMLGILGTAFMALPARADDDGWHGHQQRREWQENRGRENEWRRHERGEDRGEWREQAWRERPYYYAPPPVNAYYYPPPVVTYAPQPYYAPPGISFYFGSD